jgi:hypothetical protein
VRQNDHIAHLLVGVTRVDAETEVNFNGGVKASVRRLFDQLDRFFAAVQTCSRSTFAAAS